MSAGRVGWWLLVCAAAPLLAYASALGNGFVWDDHAVIEKGRLIGSLANVPALFLHDAMWNSDGGAFAARATVDTYRPLTLTTFALERAAFGLWPAPYHAVSVLLHAANVLLLFALGRRLGASPAAAGVGALLFAVHPAISEAVHWINGRSDPLALGFFLGAVLVWLPLRDQAGSRASVGRALLVAFLVLLATLSKETAFLLAAAALPVLGLACWQGLPRAGWGGRAALVALLPWGAALAVGFALRLVALGRPAVSGGGAHLSHAVVRIPLIYGDALSSLALPAARLRPSLHEHYATVRPLSVGLALVAVLGLGAIAVVAWRRRFFLPVWALATFLVTLAPISLLTYTEGWSGWGRYLYASAALVSLVLGVALVDLLVPRLHRVARLGAFAAVGVAVLLCGAQTFAAGEGWRNERAFALAQIADDPASSMGYSALALEEYEAGNFTRALPLAERAVAIAPRYAEHHARHALVLSRLGRAAEAWQAAQRALALDRTHRLARYIAALGFLQQRREEDAARALVALIAEEPDAPGLWGTLREAAGRLGPGSRFAATVRGLAADPRHAAVAPALRAAVR